MGVEFLVDSGVESSVASSGTLSELLGTISAGWLQLELALGSGLQCWTS